MKDKDGVVQPETIIGVEYWDPDEKLPEPKVYPHLEHTLLSRGLTTGTGEVCFYSHDRKEWYNLEGDGDRLDPPKLWAYIPELR